MGPVLTGELAHAESATLRYRLWHIAAKIACHARRTRLRLDRHWPWAGEPAADVRTACKHSPPPEPSRRPHCARRF